MKVKIVKERECCQYDDFKPIEGTPLVGRNYEYVFCMHCGAHHMGRDVRDPAGATDWEYSPLTKPWLK